MSWCELDIAGIGEEEMWSSFPSEHGMLDPVGGDNLVVFFFVCNEKE